MKLRIVADDLTGALDARGAARGARRAAAGALAASARSRRARRASPSTPNPATPRRRAPAWLEAFAGADLAYKKIDSLLRGNTVHEIAACLASGRFASALIAPAFPAQQRITRGGRQYWRPAPPQAWQPVACDLAEAARARPSSASPASAADVGGRGSFLCDAGTRGRSPRARRRRPAPRAAAAVGRQRRPRPRARRAAPPGRALPRPRAAAADGHRQPPPGHARADRGAAGAHAPGLVEFRPGAGRSRAGARGPAPAASRRGARAGGARWHRRRARRAVLRPRAGRAADRLPARRARSSCQRRGDVCIAWSARSAPARCW